MIVEDKILEYLDGSLGERESAELLETLAANPEKRALLEEHLRLKDLLTLGRKPFQVPLATEQALAERIPILGRANRFSPFGIARGMRDWIGARMIGARAIGAAMGAGALVVLIGLGWYGHATQETTPAKTSTLAPSNVAPSAVSPSNVASTPSNVASAPSNVGMAPANITNVPSANGFAGGRAGVGTQARERVSIAGNAGHAVREASVPLDEASATSGTVPKAPAEAAYSISSVPEGSLRTPAMEIPNGHIAQTMREIAMGPPREMSRFSAGASLILDESFAPSVSTGPSGAFSKPIGDATLDYDLSSSFAIGLDLGEASSATITNSLSRMNAQNDLTRIAESSVITSQTIVDILATAHFTLFAESELPVRFGIGAGEAFGAGPVVDATAGISPTIAPDLTLDLSAIASRVWTNGNPQVLTPAASGITGIVGGQSSARSLYTTAFGIRAGLRMRL